MKAYGFSEQFFDNLNDDDLMVLLTMATALHDATAVTGEYLVQLAAHRLTQRLSFIQLDREMDVRQAAFEQPSFLVGA